MDSRVIALNKQIAALQAEGDALIESDAVDTAAGRSKLEKLGEDIKAKRSEIEKIEAAREALRKAVGNYLPNDYQTEGAGHLWQAAAVSRLGMVGATYADLFGKPAADPIFKSAGEFLQTVSQGMYHPGLVAAAAGMEEGSGAGGGYLVPGQLAAPLLDFALRSSNVLRRCRVVPMQSQTLTVPAFQQTDLSGTEGYFGGLQFKFVGEGGTMTASKPKLRSMNLVAKKGYMLVPASNEWLADSGGEAALITAMREACRDAMDYYILRGIGAAQPLGVMQSPALITASKESGQAADTFIIENAANMVGRLHPSAFANAVWFISPTLTEQVANMSVAVGTGGAVVGVPGTVPTSLFNIPIVWSDLVESKGNLGDVILADMSRYVVGLRKEITIESSAHAGFSTDETYFRLTVRFDGQGAWDEAFTPRDGETLSPFVTLEAR